MAALVSYQLYTHGAFVPINKIEAEMMEGADATSTYVHLPPPETSIQLWS